MPHYFDVFLAPIRDNPVAQVLLAALLLGIALDVTLGLTCAALTHSVKSAKMRLGVQHKLAELGLVLAADIIDGIIAGGLDLRVSPVLVSTLLFLVLMELFSICENCIKMNPDFVDVPVVGAVAKLVHEAKGGDEPKGGE